MKLYCKHRHGARWASNKPFSIDGLFGHKNWDYIVIPKGTLVPKELIITKDHYIAKKKSWHYSISPNFDMPVSEFLAALDTLAFNAKIKIKVKSYG
ncbi:hypothetical protein [Pseudoalteromonas ostreae]|uniref:Tse2 family ADP-ribosyltransferase toxin n=1 Tax=Pseudoalteromonas ostreae TaxID=2774154 RepID=UPI003CE51A0B